MAICTTLSFAIDKSLNDKLPKAAFLLLATIITLTIFSFAGVQLRRIAKKMEAENG
jgi:hypothetical protein